MDGIADGLRTDQAHRFLRTGISEQHLFIHERRRRHIRKRPVETVVGNGQFRDAGGGTGMTDWRVVLRLSASGQMFAKAVPSISAELRIHGYATAILLAQALQLIHP